MTCVKRSAGGAITRFANKWLGSWSTGFVPLTRASRVGNCDRVVHPCIRFGWRIRCTVKRAMKRLLMFVPYLPRKRVRSVTRRSFCFELRFRSESEWERMRNGGLTVKTIIDAPLPNFFTCQINDANCDSPLFGSEISTATMWHKYRLTSERFYEKRLFTVNCDGISSRINSD